MASLRVHPDRLEIHLTPAEKTLALRRENLVIARDTIRSVTITDDPWIWVRGIRAPGALVPLVLAVGVWKFHGGKDFLAIKRKRQAVVIDLIGDEFARVILSTNHAPDLIASLKLGAGDAADTADAADAQEPRERAALADAEELGTPVPAAKPARRVRAAKQTKTKPAQPAEAGEAPEGAAATDAEPVTPAKTLKRVRPVKPVTPAAAPAAPVEAVEAVDASPGLPGQGEAGEESA